MYWPTRTFVNKMSSNVANVRKLRGKSRKLTTQFRSEILPITAGSAKVIKGLPSYTKSLPFPNTIVRKMTYEASLQIQAGGSSAGLTGSEQNFSLNGLYDPDTTNTGHQPYGFDQLCASSGPYRRFKVFRCRVSMRLYNPEAPTMVFFAAVTNQENWNQSISGSAFTDLAEKPQIAHKRISYNGNRETVVRLDVPLHIAMGMSPATFETELSNSTGSYNGNPGWPSYLHTCVCDLAAPATGTKVWVDYKLEYTALFYDRYMLGQS